MQLSCHFPVSVLNLMSTVDWFIDTVTLIHYSCIQTIESVCLQYGFPQESNYNKSDYLFSKYLHVIEKLNKFTVHLSYL